MVAIITPENRSLYKDELDEMFRLRYEVAVRYLKWPLPGAKNGYDYDAYDREDTIYLIDFSDAGRVIACARLNPTLKPTLMEDVFPDYCDLMAMPKGPNIYEFSRFLCTKRGLTQAEFSKARTNIMLAVSELSVAYGIEQVVFLTYMKLYPITTLVWDAKPLGLPKVYAPDKTEYIAGVGHMNERTLERSKRMAGATEQVSSLVLPLSYARPLSHVVPFKKAS